MNNFNWTSDLIFEMIELYREKPELWDTSSESYKDRTKKHKAWNEIASALNTNLDVDAIQRKIRILISQYRRELNRPTPNSKWFAFKKLSFLPTDTEHSPTKLMRVKIPRSHFVSLDQEEQSTTQDLLDDGHKTEEVTLKDRHRKQVVNDTDDSQCKRDEYTTYGELVAIKLRKIGNRYARSTAQYHINNILYKAEIGAFDKRERQGKTKKSRVRAGSSSQVDSNYDDCLQLSASPSKSMDDLLKFENEDSDEDDE